jgi:hypothetical protein
MRAGMRVSFGFRQSVDKHASSLQVGWVRTGRTRRSRWFISHAASCADRSSAKRRQIVAIESVRTRKRCDKVVIDEQMRAHLLFGGGLGLGVPVVSYAPRPMIISVWEEVLVIIAERCEELRGRRVSIYRPKGLVWRNASRTRVDSPGARAAKYRGWANRRPAWDKQAQGDCADGKACRRVWQSAVFGSLCARDGCGVGRWNAAWKWQGGAWCDGSKSAKERKGREGARGDGRGEAKSWFSGECCMYFLLRYATIGRRARRGGRGHRAMVMVVNVDLENEKRGGRGDCSIYIRAFRPRSNNYSTHTAGRLQSAQCADAFRAPDKRERQQFA